MMTISNDDSKISRVTRSKAVARASYNRLSKWYDLIAGSSEWKFVKSGLELLNASPAEKILDIGFGTGKSIAELAQSAGDDGRVTGIDISEGMYEITQGRLEQDGLANQVTLCLGDATSLPFEDQVFDAVFSSFTLELFDTPEIPIVLQECRRVLRTGGRMVIVSMAKDEVDSLAVRLYEWAHRHFPNYFDCRPIYVSESMMENGFQIVETRKMKMWGLPVDVVLGIKA